MYKAFSVPRFTLMALFLSLFLLTIGGCSSGPDMETQISGKWQRTQGDGTVDINLVGTQKALTFDGHTYTPVVEKVDKQSYTIQVKVEVEAGKTEVWSLSQVWSDNGSSFKLAFRHNGTTETLTPAGQS